MFPSLLTCLDNFAHVPHWPNLENIAERRRRMLRHELHSMIHVPRLKDENAAELFLGFRVGAVGDCNLALLPIQGQGSFRPLKRFATTPIAVGAKMFVVFKAFVEHGVPLSLAHGVEFGFVVVPETDVFHCCSPDSGAMAGLFTCFRRVLVPEPDRKEARAPRREHRRRWQPSSPKQVPHPDRRLPVSRIRPCAPWFRCTARR